MFSLRFIEVDGGDLMTSEMDVVDSVFSSRSHRHRITAKCSAHLKLAVAKRDFAVGLHLANLIDDSILERRQLLRERSVADLITTRRHGHAQSFMRSLVIITMTPLIKTALHAFKVAKAAVCQQLDFQSPMKALVLALGLGMVRPTVADGNSQPQQPNRQWRMLVVTITSPGRTVVHQHPFRQTITAKSGGQSFFYRGGLLIAAGLQAQRIARTIVEHSQRMTAFSVAQGKVAFEIHLPQLIRSLLCKPLIGSYYLVRRWLHPSMTTQNRMHRTLSHRTLSRGFQRPFNLAGAPASLIPNHQRLPFEFRLAAARRSSWSTRLIRERVVTILSLSLAPFVSSLATDSESLAQLAEIAPLLICHPQKLLSQTHGATLLPRHVHLRKRFFMPLLSVTHVFGHL